MTNEALIIEITSIIDFIEETRNRIGQDYDKFQVALTNTLRLLDDPSSTLTRMRGNTDGLKGYLVKTSSEIKQITLQPYEQLKVRIEKILRLIQNT
jgi:hypothetical protein